MELLLEVSAFSGCLGPKPYILPYLEGQGDLVSRLVMGIIKVAI